MKFQFNIKMENYLTSHRFCFVNFQVHVISFDFKTMAGLSHEIPIQY